jgi:hypothetical protein
MLYGLCCVRRTLYASFTRIHLCDMCVELVSRVPMPEKLDPSSLYSTWDLKLTVPGLTIGTLQVLMQLSLYSTWDLKLTVPGLTIGTLQYQ